MNYYDFITPFFSIAGVLEVLNLVRFHFEIFSEPFFMTIFQSLPLVRVIAGLIRA